MSPAGITKATLSCFFVNPRTVLVTLFGVNAVGVTESDKGDSRPLERKPARPFDKLLLDVALGKRDGRSVPACGLLRDSRRASVAGDRARGLRALRRTLEAGVARGTTAKAAALPGAVRRLGRGALAGSRDVGAAGG